LVEMIGAFLQYYRESAKYLERSSAWVERLGIDHIREVLSDELMVKEYNNRINEALSVVQDPWKEAINNKNLLRDLYQNVKVPVETK
jgi:nitrite reductase (NADH) large subunit